MESPNEISKVEILSSIREGNIELFEKYLITNSPYFTLNSKFFLQTILDQKAYVFLNIFLEILKPKCDFQFDYPYVSDMESSIFFMHGYQARNLSIPWDSFNEVIENLTDSSPDIRYEHGIEAYTQILKDLSLDFCSCTNPLDVAIKLLTTYHLPSPQSFWSNLKIRHHQTIAKELADFFQVQKDLQVAKQKEKPNSIIEFNDTCFYKLRSILLNKSFDHSDTFGMLCIFMFSEAFECMAYAIILKNNPNLKRINFPSSLEFKLNHLTYSTLLNALLNNDTDKFKECIEKGEFSPQTYKKIFWKINKQFHNVSERNLKRSCEAYLRSFSNVPQEESPVALFQLVLPKLEHLEIYPEEKKKIHPELLALIPIKNDIVENIQLV